MMVADPVNETKMSENEAFQAFLSKNDDEGSQDDYWQLGRKKSFTQQ